MIIHLLYVYVPLIHKSHQHCRCVANNYQIPLWFKFLLVFLILFFIGFYWFDNNREIIRREGIIGSILPEDYVYHKCNVAGVNGIIYQPDNTIWKIPKLSNKKIFLQTTNCMVMCNWGKNCMRDKGIVHIDLGRFARGNYQLISCENLGFIKGNRYTFEKIER